MWGRRSNPQYQPSTGLMMGTRTFARNMLRLASHSGVSWLSQFLDAAISMNSGIEDITRSLVFV